MQEVHSPPSTAQGSSIFSSLVRPVQRFFQMEAAGGILLMISAAIAIIWANSPYAASYFHLWEAHVAIEVGHSMLSMHLLHWINDGLMAIFFLVVGLEIKREVLSGELASPKKAALPIAGAIGGMVIPALIYFGFTAGTPEVGGWGTPMATDIAFALGVVILLGKRVPAALKIFLVALAIVDDLGAVLVIAFFYTSELSLMSLGVGGGFLVALIVANRFGVRRPAVYVALGIGLWVAFLQSGIHATIAGVLLALTIPSNRKIGAYAFMAKGKDLVYKYMGSTEPEQKELTHDQEHAIHDLETAIKDVSSPLVRMEHALHGWVNFLIMPVFAFANAGVTFVGGDISAALLSHVTLGIVFGLIIGKQVGVFAFSWASVKLGIAEMPSGTTWRQFYGVSALAGIGFTMSLFIATLAFGSGEALANAKIGILLASLIAGLTGWYLLANAASPVEEDVVKAVPVSGGVSPAVLHSNVSETGVIADQKVAAASVPDEVEEGALEKV